MWTNYLLFIIQKLWNYVDLYTKAIRECRVRTAKMTNSFHFAINYIFVNFRKGKIEKSVKSLHTKEYFNEERNVSLLYCILFFQNITKLT